MQIIQSLGEAMTWFERELQWDVAPAELRHLCGRIGELYAALISNGQMALDVNQRGYDVVGGDGDRISVKTTTMLTASGHVSFNAKTLDKVDRVIVLRINTEEMQIETLFDGSIDECRELMTPDRSAGRQNISLGKFVNATRQRTDIATVREVRIVNQLIRELETGTIELEIDGVLVSPVKPHLRKIANSLGINITNSNGNPHTTRQLGTILINALLDSLANDQS
jgi:hypothetical protein